eukprot:596104-Prorocentrum_lima.AAC.1
MTSSLVGSEMCIRDRNCGPSSPTIAHLHMHPRVMFHVVMDMRRASFTDAVSYTHLTLPTICSV